MLIKKSEISVEIENHPFLSTKEYPFFIEKVKFIKKHKVTFGILDKTIRNKTLYSDEKTFKEIKETVNQYKRDSILLLLLILFPLSSVAYFAAKNLTEFFICTIGMTLLFSIPLSSLYFDQVQKEIKEILNLKGEIK